MLAASVGVGAQVRHVLLGQPLCFLKNSNKQMSLSNPYEN